MQIKEQATLAKQASYQMMNLPLPVKNAALFAMAQALTENTKAIVAANEKDVEAARSNGKPEAMLDRLRLTEARIAGMAEGLKKVAALPDPVGSEEGTAKRPNGLMISKRRVPLGVVGIICEARPNVTTDAIGLCVKSGNALVLRGGSEAIQSNICIVNAVLQAAVEAGLPQGAIQLITDTTHEGAQELMRLNGLVDVLIPRGGAKLIQSVVKNASVPVIETGAGNCHVYVDAGADIEMAKRIIYNAKTSRPAVCNAIETVLVERSVANAYLAELLAPLAKKQVELRGCEACRAILPDMKPATEADWAEEYDDYILAVKVVENVSEAISHINRYGTHHSDCIVTRDYARAEQFLNEVDSAAVYVNASTRFTDGEEFGFGAEIGISTQKLHARGPMGLNELTTVKYVVRGGGQVR
ncbi:MAG: glutamate-5-semialdehyde dehydrogenase [Eubacteriales bacterium]|nr:glutamate-5-semialdehyde dehydrogenase [Eubacteriales bacterium]